MSSLRNYDSETSRNYTDKLSFNISESDNVSQTKDRTLEDHQAPIDTEKYTMILENYHTHSLRKGPTDTEARALVRQKMETNKTHWRELIEQNDYDPMEFYAKTVRKHCRKKLSSNEIDEKAAKHYREILAIIIRHNLYYI